MSRRRLVLVAAAVVAVLGIGSGVALARSGSSSPGYRLAVAGPGAVEQDLVSVGTVSAVSRAAVSFPVSGTVASVFTKLGAKVSAGDVLATLSTTGLNQQVVAAEAALATAQQALAADEASRSGTTATLNAGTPPATLSAGTTPATLNAATTPAVGAITAVLTAAVTPAPVVGSGSGRTGAGVSGGAARTTGTGGIAGATAAVSAAQQQLARTRATLDRDLAAAENALQSCATDLAQQPGSPAPPASPTGSASSSPSSSASPSPTASTSGPPPAADPAARCLAAIGRAPGKARIDSDRQAVTAAEARLNAAISTLTAAARAAASSASSGKGTGTSSTGTGKAGAGTSASATRSGQGQQSGNQSSSSGNSQAGNQQTGSQQAGRGSGTAGPASAEKLAADSAQIDAANANLLLARRNLAAAVLTSPITGTVAAVTMSPGQAASATSSSITVIGPGQEQVSTTVSLAGLDVMKVGDPATVTVDGVATPLPGRVSAIGLLNTTTGSTTSYPVTVLLAPSTERLFDGSGASVTIRVAKVEDVLTVPSSAVHSAGRLSTVTRVKDGKASSVRVTVGAVGGDRTEVRSGLIAGDQVVLATLGTPLPSSDSTTNRRLTGGIAGGSGTFGSGTFGGGTGRPGG